MKILLTGGSGFVGRYVCHEMDKQKMEYINLQRTGSPLQCTTQNMRKVDLLGREDLDRLLDDIKPTHLIHLAWYAEHGKFWESELNTLWNTATNRLVKSFIKSGGKHVFISGTCAEYDWRYGYCKEDITPTKPNSLYGIAKNTTRMTVELICQKYDVSFGWGRIFNPYGFGEAPQRLIPSLFRAFKDEIPPFGVNANCYRDFLHIEDVARAILACTKTKLLGEVNISSGQPFLIKKLVERIAVIFNKNPNKILDIEPLRIEPYPFLVGPNEKLKSSGWQQDISLNEGLFNYQL